MTSAEIAKYVAEQSGLPVIDRGDMVVHKIVSLVPLGCIGNVVVYKDNDSGYKMGPIPFSAPLATA